MTEGIVAFITIPKVFAKANGIDEILRTAQNDKAGRTRAPLLVMLSGARSAKSKHLNLLTVQKTKT